MSLLNTLNIGYSALNSAQVAINTTGHNISNAETEGYTRQRLVTTSSTPLSFNSGNIGNGVEIQDIKRVFDNFVFDKYANLSADKEYSDFQQQTLEHLSTYFPDIDGVGVKADISEYFNMWQTFADNPGNDSIKVALARQAQTMAQHITSTQDQVTALQLTMNDQLESNINQVNHLAEQLADLNITIDNAETAGTFTASDLRDKRNVIERDLARLIGADVSQDQIVSNIGIDSNSNTRTGSYTLNINGFNLVDGNNFHPLYIDNKENKSGFFEISSQRQDGVLVPMETIIRGGKIGAILNLRGGAIDTTSGLPSDGTLQTVITQLNAFSTGLIESTNNLYAANATTKKESNLMDIDPSDALLSSTMNINQGAFDIVIYDVDGYEVAKRTIDIDLATSMSGAAGSNSIEGQIISNKDDNSDGNANNNVDDFLNFNYQESANGELRLDLSVKALEASQGYTFSVADNLSTEAFSSGSNFAGAIGLGRFFDGNNGQNIDLSLSLRDNPTNISSGFSSTAGDNRVALNMVQQQYEEYNFKVGDNKSYNSTIYGMYDITATYVGVSTNAAISKNETITTQYNATELEYFSVSKVSIDEEMTNLIKYQTSYGAAAKVITTVDQMMQTLLGIKQ